MTETIAIENLRMIFLNGGRHVDLTEGRCLESPLLRFTEKDVHAMP
jgi:hypothetical protein